MNHDRLAAILPRFLTHAGPTLRCLYEASHLLDPGFQEFIGCGGEGYRV